MKIVPKSPSEKVLGMVWFGRMLDKIRLKSSEQLPEAYHSFLGKGFDGRCIRYLRVDYAHLVAQVLKGGTDEEILEWCFERGRRLSEEDVEIWNGFISKRGLRDSLAVTENLEACKAASGLDRREDIDTFFIYNDVDEGRLP